MLIRTIAIIVSCQLASHGWLAELVLLAHACYASYDDMGKRRARTSNCFGGFHFSVKLRQMGVPGSRCKFDCNICKDFAELSTNEPSRRQVFHGLCTSALARAIRL